MNRKFALKVKYNWGKNTKLGLDCESHKWHAEVTEYIQ